jgi:aspartyl-tRNA(Asn)/glutamyl-tRNA(Gln) amidotransferase subunit C
MSISEADVRHVASLARVQIGDDRIAPLVAEMNRILDYVGVLQRIEIGPATDAEQHSGVSATAIASAPLRPDLRDAVPLDRPIAEFAPSERDGFLLVPRLASHA